MAGATSSIPHAVVSPSQTMFTSIALKSASSLMLLQALTRAATFGLNQSLVRLVSPEIFGTATIQFELLLSTILFLSREGVRNAMLRAPTASGEKVSKKFDSKATAVSFLPIVVGIPVAVMASSVYLYTSDPSTVRAQPHFDLAVSLYTIAAVLELLSEPLQIRAQNELQFGVRVRAEGTGVILKALSTVAMLVFRGPKWALPSFAIGQVLYGLSVLATYVWEYRSFVMQSWKISGLTSMDQTLFRLSAAMTSQSVVKHFLTEGDKFVISRISSLEDQGGYAVASNYGSLVARIIFQPIEETSRLFFSKSLSSAENAKTEDKEKPKGTKNSVETAATALQTILLFYTHLALVLMTFGPPYIPTLLSIILPRRYQTTSAPRILKTYCTSYLPTMAFNGVLEAFVSSTATSSDLARQSKWMVFFSASFVIATYVFVEVLGWKETGLVWANVVNLGMRAIYCWIFAGAYFAKLGRRDLVGISKILPPFPVLGVFLVSGGIVRYSAPVVTLGWRNQAQHVGIGISCLLACVATCYATERKALINALQVLREKPALKQS